MKSKIIGLVLALMVFTSLSSVYGDVVNIFASDDTYIHNSRPDTNFNGDGENIQLVTNNYLSQYYSLIKFDLSSVPDGAVIESVSLNLCALSTSDAYLYIYRASDDDWSEDTVTFGSYSDSLQPADLTLLSAENIQVFGSGNKTWFDISLPTALTEDLSDGTLTILLSCGDVTYYYSLGAYITSTEYSDVSGSGDYDPYLCIAYVPEPLSLMLLGLGGAAMLRKR